MDIDEIILQIGDLLEGLAEQQAIPDELWRIEWERLRTALQKYDEEWSDFGEQIS